MRTTIFLLIAIAVIVAFIAWITPVQTTWSGPAEPSLKERCPSALPWLCPPADADKAEERK